MIQDCYMLSDHITVYFLLGAVIPWFIKLFYCSLLAANFISNLSNFVGKSKPLIWCYIPLFLWFHSAILRLPLYGAGNNQNLGECSERRTTIAAMFGFVIGNRMVPRHHDFPPALTVICVRNWSISRHDRWWPSRPWSPTTVACSTAVQTCLCQRLLPYHWSTPSVGWMENVDAATNTWESSWDQSLGCRHQVNFGQQSSWCIRSLMAVVCHPMYSTSSSAIVVCLHNGLVTRPDWQ